MIACFRADASLAIGSGHVMRCLALADELRERGHRCVFVGHELEGQRFDVVRARGHEQVVLPALEGAPYGADEGAPPHAAWLAGPWRQDAAATRAAAEAAGADLLVLDHYGLDARWQAAARPAGVGLMVLDDLADRPHGADLLLDQNLGRAAADYDGLVPESCRLLVGPTYAMVAPRFGELRAASLERRSAQAERAAGIGSILISMGGVDAGDASGASLAALEAWAPPGTAGLPDATRVTIVMGAHAPHLARVRERAAASRLAAEVVVDVRDMAERMAAADLALGGAGGTAWERCALGLPTIVLVLAPNQAPGARALEQAGAAILADSPAEVGACLATLSDPARLAQVGRAAAAAVDGRGLARACDAMEQLMEHRV